MKFIPNYRVCYGDRFYEAGTPFPIKADDANMMKRHGTVLDKPTLPPAPNKRSCRTRRVDNEQSCKIKTSDE